MNASGLTDEKLERRIANARKVLEDGAAHNPEMIREILAEAEAERNQRRERGQS